MPDYIVKGVAKIARLRIQGLAPVSIREALAQDVIAVSRRFEKGVVSLKCPIESAFQVGIIRVGAHSF